MKNKKRNKIGQFTSLASYWNKNRYRWLTLVSVTIIAYSAIFFSSDLLQGLYRNVEPYTGNVAQAESTDKVIEEICSLPYVDCGTTEERKIKEWIYNRWLQNTDEETARKAMRIVGECENRDWNPDVVVLEPNNTYSCGIFQINSVHIPARLSNDQCLDYQHNTDVAIQIYLEQGFSPWTCSRILDIK